MKVHLQVNPGGTFPVTACGLVVVGKRRARLMDVRPDRAYATVAVDNRCKACERERLRPMAAEA